MELFSKEEEKRIVEAIKAAELGTSAEVKVHIDKYCKGNPVEQAVKWFYTLEMEKTAAANGVLIYIAYKDRKMAIIGDKGIDAVVEEGFWDFTYELMRQNFSAGNHCEGLCRAIENVSTKLKEFFPYTSDDINELSDEISYGK
ncbi:MAG: TPM domain-containing protein [Rikenellaceae bacterium]